MAQQENTSQNTPVSVSGSDRLAVAGEIVRKASYWGAGLSLVPVPVFDLAAVVGVQLAMVKKLCELYGVSFRRDIGKTLIGSLTAGITASGLSPIVGSAIKFIPVIGPIAGTLTMPALSGAATLAVGRVFTSHFESEGTLLDFDAVAYRAKIDELVKEEIATQKKPASK